MAFIPRKNTGTPGRSPGRSSARPGKRSLRSPLTPPRPFTRGAYFQVKKPRWVPRPTGTLDSAGASRKFADTRAPSPFPQKAPYRPGGPVASRAPYTKRAPTISSAKGPARAGGRYGFLPRENKKADTGSTARAFTPRSTKPAFKFVKAKPPRTQYAKYAPLPAQKGKQAATSWGAVATWYDKHLASADTYHEKVILPNLTRLVDAQKGELIIDLASGQGYFTRALAKNGAKLTGIDISPELVAIAKKESPEITYHVGSAENLSELGDEHFDKAIIVLAIQNIEHVHKVMSEAARVTKNGGTFHVVMNHPAFRIPKQSSWGYDEKQKVQYRRVEQYLSESRSAIDMHPGMKDSPQTISFHRSLQYYIKALVKAGFVVDRFEEWISHKDSDSGPRAQAENRARKEIPLFLYMRARKI